MPLVMIRRLGFTGALAVVFAVAVALFGQIHAGHGPHAEAQDAGLTVTALQRQLEGGDTGSAVRRHDIGRADLAWPFFSFRRRGAR